MKKLLTVAAASLLLNHGIKAQTTWNVDASHSKLRFSVVHMMVAETEGKFKVFDGKAISKTDTDFTDASITFTADAASIDTDDAKRDAHLRSPDFFDVEKHPTISFTSVRMKPTGKAKTSYELEGDLTMHGVTKRVKLLAIGASQTVKDPYGNTKYGFRVTGKLNRKDFGLSWNAALEAGGVAVSEEVNIALSIELNKA